MYPILCPHRAYAEPRTPPTARASAGAARWDCTAIRPAGCPLFALGVQGALGHTPNRATPVFSPLVASQHS